MKVWVLVTMLISIWALVAGHLSPMIFSVVLLVAIISTILVIAFVIVQLKK